MADQEIPPPVDGTEIRLDAILAELRALRAALGSLVASGLATEAVGPGEPTRSAGGSKRKRG